MSLALPPRQTLLAPPGAAFACLLLAACTVSSPSICEPVHACEAGVFSLAGCGVSLPLEDCAASGMRCDAVLGCTGCQPGALRCDGERLVRCGEDGLDFELERVCSDDGASTCSGNACVDACELAAQERSYLGCEYDAVSTLNSLLASGFDLGLVVGNPSEAPAHVRVSRAGAEVAQVTIAPGSADTIRLAPVEELSRAGWSSSYVLGGSYEVVSDRPIAAYQFNPLEFRRSPECHFTGTASDRECFSFTNDASLLLPRSARGTEHVVDTMGGPTAAFVSIVASQTAHVRVVPTAELLASDDGAIPAAPAGEALELTVEAGAVLQLVTRSGSLTGTEVRSDVPVGVVSGNDCANVPSSFAACDHLEEVMPPVPTWGTEAIAAAPATREGEPSVLRILSGDDGNEISISGVPTTVQRDRGEVFELLARGDVAVHATRPILVTQYLVGAAFYDRAEGHDGRGALGDPSMGIVAPTAQFRRAYAFVVPSTYVESFAAIVAEEDDDVRLDGRAIDAWSSLEGTGFRVARIALAGGAHSLTSMHGAGLTLYGIAPYTSYLLPGGLDVELLR